MPKREQGHEEPISPPVNSEENDLSDGEASNHGRGTDDTLRVTQILEEHGILNCLVGVSALKFYGAGRVRDVSFFYQKRGLTYHVLCDLFKTDISHRTGRFVFQRGKSLRLEQSCCPRLAVQSIAS